MVPKIACQTITWGPDRLRDQYKQVLEQVKQAGFDGVETNFAVLQHNGEHLGDWLSQQDLRLVTAHYGARPLMNLSAQARHDALEWLAGFQAEYFLISSDPDFTKDEYRALAQAASDFATLAKEYGIQVCFHHHDWELRNGAAGLRFMLEQTGPEVGLAADFGWVLRSGMTVENFLKLVDSRLKYVHLKDSAAGQWVEMGYGELPVDKILSALLPLELPWWTAEQDTTSKDPLESASWNARYLRQFLTSRG